MGLQDPQLVSQRQMALVGLQINKDTPAVLTAADGIECMQLDLNNTGVIEASQRFTRSRAPVVNRHQLLGQTVEFGMVSELIGNGVAGTFDDLHPLLASMFGDVTQLAGSVTYQTLISPNHPTISAAVLGNAEEPSLGRWASGLVMETMQYSLDAKNRPLLTFAGFGTTENNAYAQAKRTTLDGAVTNSDTLIVPATDDQLFGFWPGARLQVGATTDLVIDNVIEATRALVLSTGGHTFADGEIVRPYAPTPVVSGVPVAGTRGSFTYRGQSIPIKGLDWTLNNNFARADNRFGTVYVADATPQNLSLEGTFTCDALESVAQNLKSELQRRAMNPADDIPVSGQMTIVNGVVPGNIWTWTINLILTATAVSTAQGPTPADFTFTYMGSDSVDGARDIVTLVRT